MSRARALVACLRGSAGMAGRSGEWVVAAPRRLGRRGVGYGVANRVGGLRYGAEEGRAVVSPVLSRERCVSFRLDDTVGRLMMKRDALDEASVDSLISSPPPPTSRAREHAIHLSLAPEYQVPVNLNINYSEFGITNSWDQRSEATCALRHIRTTEGRMV